MQPFLTRALPEVAIVSSSRFVTADQDVANFVFGKNDLSALSAVARPGGALRNARKEIRQREAPYQYCPNRGVCRMRPLSGTACLRPLSEKKIGRASCRERVEK